MVDFAADDYGGIAQRMRELEQERGRVRAPDATVGGLGQFGIWFAPGDRQPGWCRVNSSTGKWGIFRPGDAIGPTLFDSEDQAHLAISLKASGAWSIADMTVRKYS